MRRFAVPMVLGALAMTAVTSRAEAQPNIFFGGGPSFPVGDFKDNPLPSPPDFGAKTGWLLQGGIGIDIGSRGLFIEAEGFFGSNSHENTGNFKDKTNILAFMGALGYSFGADDAKVNPYVLAGAGILGNQFRTDNDANVALEGTENEFGYTGAVGLSFRLNEKARFWVEGRYLGSSNTTLIPFAAGISLTLGGGGGGM
ncbi:MAG TPA: outer membrane beta-barrel protein [Gemmatimonadales bacterium]|nr:outer membrane beta-barrel protein [Gemmatimonadales bacterium]